MRRIVMVDRGRPLITIQLDDLPSTYPFALGVPQSTTEELLAERLDELGGTVRRNWRVEALAQDPDGVAITGFDHNGPAVPFELRARFLIGADGSRSIVRSAIGMDFPGDTYAARFVLADIALDVPSAADDQATINLSPRGVTVLGRLPGGNQRLVATVEDTEDEQLVIDRAFVEEMLQQRGIGATPLAEPAWSSQFRIHHRVADRFRVDRVFLAGDAAHIHSPAAGQGTNTGIADAFDIASKLAAVLRGESDETALDLYDQRRRAAALEVLKFTDRITRVATLRSPIARGMRRLLARTVGRSARVKRHVAMWVTGLERSPLRVNQHDGRTAPTPAAYQDQGK